jgi:hypothetical protein
MGDMEEEGKKEKEKKQKHKGMVWVSVSPEGKVVNIYRVLLLFCVSVRESVTELEDYFPEIEISIFDRKQSMSRLGRRVASSKNNTREMRDPKKRGEYCARRRRRRVGVDWPGLA